MKDATHGRDSQPPRSDLTAIWQLAKAALGRINDHGISDRAAALTYYSVMSLFPGLIVLISLLGVLGENTMTTLVSSLRELAPGPVREVLIGIVEEVAGAGTTASIALIVGTVIGLFSASGYIGAFMRAANVVWETSECRPFWKTIPIRLAITSALVAMIAVIVLSVVLTGPLANNVLELSGYDHTGTLLWDLLKWPALLALTSLALSILYHFAPDTDTGKFKWFSAGGVAGTTVWLLASLGFSVYVANFGSYNNTYGTLGGVVIFLVWLWITNLAVLLGLELNAEIKRYTLAHGRSPFKSR